MGLLWDGTFAGATADEIMEGLLKEYKRLKAAKQAEAVREALKSWEERHPEELHQEDTTKRNARLFAQLFDEEYQKLMNP